MLYQNFPEDDYPIIINYPDGYDFEFCRLGIYAIATNINTTSGGSVNGEISVQAPIGDIILTDARINFSYNHERERMARNLTDQCRDFLFPIWNSVIQIICTEVIERHRKLHPEEEIKVPSWLSLETVQTETVKWLWEPYIPMGKMTLLEGDPGIGKSWITLAIATAVSLGVSLPGQDEMKYGGPVLIASAEDGIADTIKPRLQAMKANLFDIKAVTELITLDMAGFDLLETYISETLPNLLIIDPLVAYFSGDMDINRANAVRWGTSRIAKLADKWGFAALCVRHLTKGGSLKPIYRGLGSIDFTASARSVLLAGCDFEDEHDYGIVHIKSNLAKKGEAIGYSLDNGSFYWLEHSDLTAGRILTGIDNGGSPGQIAEVFLTSFLNGQRIEAKEIFEEAKNQGISEKTLRRAKDKLNIIAYREGEKGKKGGGKWYWRLPQKED